MTGSASFKVTVVDKIAPTIAVPADITVPGTSSNGAIVNFTVSASDLVDGSVAVTCTPASGSTFPLGTTTVSCSATDKAGNTASATFNVTVTGGVFVTLLSSSGKGLSGAVVQYYSGGWKSFGTTGSDGTARMLLAAGSYDFQMTYAGASIQKSQNVGTNPNVKFQTVLVTMKLLSSSSKELNGTAQYTAGAGGWMTFGGGTTTTTMELLPTSYAFQITYAEASWQFSQNTASNPNVLFRTTLVTVELLASDGSTQLSGTVQYYSAGWRTFGGGTTTTTMELLPTSYARTSYNFLISYAGASQQLGQNVTTNPLVRFQTVQVHSDSGKCTSYNAGNGWKTFTQDMQLLPGTYTFRFSDGTTDTSYTLVIGAVNHIH
jgi:hypothetical protein